MSPPPMRAGYKFELIQREGELPEPLAQVRAGGWGVGGVWARAAAAAGRREERPRAPSVERPRVLAPPTARR